MERRKKPKILFYGGCWPTNIGNAFVNIGAMESIRLALGSDAHIDLTSGLSAYLFGQQGVAANSIEIGRITQYDFVVIGGMTFCKPFVQSQRHILEQWVKRGARLVVAGGGAGEYTLEEVAEVHEAIAGLPIHALISRDHFSFDNYSDLAAFSYDGIDSAFFISMNFQPLNLSLPPFDVATFDKFPEPKFFNGGEFPGQQASVYSEPSHSSGLERGLFRRIRQLLHPQDAAPRPTSSEIDLQGRLLLRTHHAICDPFVRPEYFSDPQTLLSDLPSDYLSVYSMANTVYSDRIHACVATLAFGNRAMLFGAGEPRLRMFERVGVSKVLEGPCQLDMNHLREEQENQISFLRTVFD